MTRPSLAVLLRSFVVEMRVRRYSESTVAAYRQHVARFVVLCRRRGVTRAADVATPQLYDYQAGRWTDFSGMPTGDPGRIIA